MIKISVIVAAWNAAPTIERCVASVIAQRDIDLELIIIDDGSTDETAAVVSGLTERYPNIVFAATPKNSGPSAARNIGLALAHGDWVAIVDSDDTIEPGRLARMAAWAEQNGADICFDNMNLVQAEAPSGPKTLLIDAEKALPLHKPWTVKSYADTNCPYDSPVLTGFLKPLFRLSFLRQNALFYNEDLSNSEDYLLIVEALIRGAKIVYLDSPLYNYFVYKGSLSGAFNPVTHQKLMAAERALATRFRASMSEQDRQALDHHLASLARAEVTNALFLALRTRDAFAFLKTLGRDKKNVLIHAKRIATSILNKILSKTNRGR